MFSEYTDLHSVVLDGRSVLRCYALSTDKYLSQY